MRLLSVSQWMMKIKERNLCDWEEETETKSSLRWYRLEKDDGKERCRVHYRDMKE